MTRTQDVTIYYNTLFVKKNLCRRPVARFHQQIFCGSRPIVRSEETRRRVLLLYRRRRGRGRRMPRRGVYPKNINYRITRDYNTMRRCSLRTRSA